MKQVIAIVGMPGAGKSETAAFFKEKQIPILRFGDETDIGLRELGKELTQENERWYRENLRRELGMAAYAIKIKPRVDNELSKHSRVVLDGLYSWEEYVHLQQFYPDLILLCIYARPEVRYKRLTTRSIRPLSKEEARKRDIAELEKLNKGGPIALADYMIINEESLANLHKQLATFITILQK